MEGQVLMDSWTKVVSRTDEFKLVYLNTVTGLFFYLVSRVRESRAAGQPSESPTPSPPPPPPLHPSPQYNEAASLALGNLDGVAHAVCNTVKRVVIMIAMFLSGLESKPMTEQVSCQLKINI